MTLRVYIKRLFRQYYLKLQDIFVRTGNLRSIWGKSLMGHKDVIQYETVTIVVRGARKDNLRMVPVTNFAGYVYVETFNSVTCETGKIEKDIPDDGIVHLEIPYGVHYAVHSEVDGLGASFTLTYTASQDHRRVYLWNLPLGVWSFGWTKFTDLVGYQSIIVPSIGTVNYEEADEISGRALSPDNLQEYVDQENAGVLVSDSKVSFIVGDAFEFSDFNCADVPGITYVSNDWTDSPWEASGAFNTKKLLIANRLSAHMLSQFRISAGKQAYVPSIFELKCIGNDFRAVNEYTTSLNEGKYLSVTFKSAYTAYIATLQDGLDATIGESYYAANRYAIIVYAFTYDV